jgi:hypothetical protein
MHGHIRALKLATPIIQYMLHFPEVMKLAIIKRMELTAERSSVFRVLFPLINRTMTGIERTVYNPMILTTHPESLTTPHLSTSVRAVLSNI